jgi:hypothetical protein
MVPAERSNSRDRFLTNSAYSIGSLRELIPAACGCFEFGVWISCGKSTPPQMSSLLKKGVPAEMNPVSGAPVCAGARHRAHERPFLRFRSVRRSGRLRDEVQHR